MEFSKIKLQMVREKTEEYNTKISTPIDIVNFINQYERYDLSPNEKIIVIGLNTKNEVTIYTEATTGTIRYSHIDMAEIFKPLLLANCSKFIITHNHPSGDATPSKQDIDLTKQIIKASQIMGIEFLDHIIMGENSYTSIISEMKGGK